MHRDTSKYISLLTLWWSLLFFTVLSPLCLGHGLLAGLQDGHPYSCHLLPTAVVLGAGDDELALPVAVYANIRIKL